MTDVDIIVWDVGRGDAIFVDGPDENAMIDLGKHPNGFSPSEHMSSEGVNNIGFLLISHPDEDHIRDIVNFFDEYSPKTLRRPKAANPYIKHRKDNIYPQKEDYQEIAGKYLEIDDHFSGSVSVSPRSAERNEGLTFTSYSHDPEDVGITPADELGPDEDPNINDLSFLTVMEYSGFKLLTMGDLEDDAIEQLLEKSHVQSRVSGTDVLIAPHHGLDSSFTPELFKHISPELVAISDAGGTDASASSKYSNQAEGKLVERRNGSNKEKSVISTRNNGVLKFQIYSDGSYKAIID